MAENTYRLFGVAPAATVGARFADLRQINEAGFACGVKRGLIRVSGDLVTEVREGVGLTPNQPLSSSQVSACPYVKLEISTRRGLGRVLIDADSQIVLDGEDVCGVQVLAPPSWTNVTPQTGPLSGRVWDVHGAIPVVQAHDSDEIFGRLTEFQQVAAGQQLVFVRPRGGRRFTIFSQAVLQTMELWAGVPVAGLQAGTLIFPAFDQRTVDLAPGVTHLRTQPFVSGADVGIVWEVAAQ